MASRIEAERIHVIIQVRDDGSLDQSCSIQGKKNNQDQGIF